MCELFLKAECESLSSSREWDEMVVVVVDWSKGSDCGAIDERGGGEEEVTNKGGGGGDTDKESEDDDEGEVDGEFEEDGEFDEFE